MKQLSGWTFAILAIAAVAFATEDEFDNGFTLGQQAYFYGWPLLIMQSSFEIYTSTTPVNQFFYYRNFITSNDTRATGPNFDTLYGLAWLDLRKGPVLLHLPKELYSIANGVTKRFWVMALYDPYTNNFENLGSVAGTQPGDYIISWRKRGPIETPGHWNKVYSDYYRVWIIQRIYTINDNAEDIQFVNSLEDKITLTALGNYYENHPIESPASASDTPSVPTGMAFYDLLCDLLVEFPPPNADNQFLSTLRPIGVVPGLKPSQNFLLTTDTVAGMVAAAANGSASIMAKAFEWYRATFTVHNGYFILPTGVYGTNYTLRAVVNRIGIAPLVVEQAIYPAALLDRTGRPLVGSHKYLIHIPAGNLPPVNGFWSVTMYNTNGYLVPNPINRFVINDRTNLHYNADGSIDIFIQATEPSDPAQVQNWLPCPAGPFQMIWRLYALEPAAIPGVLNGQGWQPPAIMPVA